MMVFQPKTILKDVNLNVIGAPLLRIFWAEFECKMNIEVALYAMCPIQQAFTDSLYNSNFQSVRSFISTFVLITARSKLVAIQNEFAEITSIFLRNSMVLHSEY